jgi:HK97 family phage prohead protease/HK97 family phage major capsid protein
MEKEHKMKITMPVTLTASDAESRIIAGRIVQWDAVGNTSAGQTKFLPNSIEFSNDTKLVLEHEQTKPIGKLMEWSEDETGITASFKIAKTTAGNDALEEAATGLRSDFSVGVQVNDWTNDKGVMAISSSSLVEVSLVTSGAIPGAEVARVAAVDTPEVSEESQEVTQSNPEGEQVSDTTVPEASAAETVEAAKVEVKAATAPYISTTVRNPIVDKASYLEHSVRAKLGSEESRMFVAAAADTTDNAGLVPTRQLTEVINGISNADRPIIDSISRGALPDAGMTFEIPKITVAPTVAVASQGGTPSETDMNSAFVSVNVQKFIGQQTFSLELLDRSSPAFFQELVRQMEFAYAKATDVAVGSALIAGGTDGGNRAAFTTGALVADFVSDAAVSIYKGTLGFAQNIIVSPEQWGALMGLVDGSNRPIFQQTINPQNAGGDLTATAIRGNLLGLNLRVSTALTDTAGLGDNTAIIVNPEAYTWYESPRLSLQTNLISTGQVQVGYYGYGAVATKLGAGAYRYMVS